VCDPSDDYATIGHGTLVAGIVGAKGNNSKGVVGVNWTSTLMSLKIADSSGNLAVSNIVNGIEFAVQMKLNYSTNIRVLNGSFGCYLSGASSNCSGSLGSIQDEIKRAGSYDMLLAAAAGNDSTNLDCGSSSCQFVPAYWSNPNQYTPNIIAVASTDSNDSMSSFSNYGTTSVQIGAPGGLVIWSTSRSSTLPYWYDDGTSFATPHVAGTAALALANSNCTASTLGLKSAIVTNVDANSLSVSSGGRLNAYGSLRGCALQNVSVSPAAGNSSSQTFTYTFHDLLGYADLDVVDILIRDFLDATNACYLAYSRTNNLVYLVADDGSTLGTGYAPGTPQTLSNSQCSIDVGASNMSGSGNVLTLAVATTFASGFAGRKIVYAAGRDVSSNNSGWQAVGTWAVPTVPTLTPATITSWSPTTSGNLSETFTAVAHDGSGYGDIQVVDILINSTLNGASACYIAYSQTYNAIYLVPDSGSGLSAGLTPGGSGTVQNTQCQISASGSSVSNDGGDNLTVSVAVTLFPGFQGNQVAYVAAVTNSGVSSGWQRMGTWR